MKHTVTCYDQRLHSVPDNLPSGVSTLKLSGNFIENLTAYDFRGCSQLRELYIANNRVQRIESNTFSSMPDLKIIMLRENQLRYSYFRLTRSPA